MAEPPPWDPDLDHLVYATLDLGSAVRALTETLGIAPSPGGRHPGRGTMNYLLSLGDGSYLEIIGPDPDQPVPPGGRSFGIERLQQPRLIGWAVHTRDIDRTVEAARARGHDPGPIRAMSRKTPEGSILNWRLTAGGRTGLPNLIPFLIDWGDTPHPSTTAARGGRLLEFRAESPDPPEVTAALDALGVTLDVARADAPALIARIAGPGGSVTIQ